MSKSMYSLILIDEVVRAVDRLAHQRGTNRSNMINQILAEHLSLKTPEKRISEIFFHVLEELDPDRLQAAQQSGNMLVLKGAVNFKYNPTIRYSIELESEAKAYVGLLKVSMRTQSKPLLTRLSMFYEMWMQIEQGNPSTPRKSIPKYEMRNGYFSRELIAAHMGDGLELTVLGKALADYLNLFDRAMDMFFETSAGVDVSTYKRIFALYEHYVENSDYVF